MSEFLELLAHYYLCDATAVLRPMSLGEVQACTDVYESVKAWFAPSFELAPVGTLERHAQLVEGYIGFVTWQDANPDLVTGLREQAMAEAQGLSRPIVR